ncbi:MAG: hypothetical protein R2909_23990 [Gemmatimonadales bacterium]
MPISFALDDRAGILRTVFSGPITRTEVEEFVEELVASGLFTHPHLIDARTAEMSLSPDDNRALEAAIGRLRSGHGHTRTAFIPGRDVDYGMARMYGMLSDSSDPGFAVFRDVEQAVVWLREAPPVDTREAEGMNGGVHD